MSFRVAARTILELGAELISSDAVAIYELVKNAIDAGSPDGVVIDFCVALRHSDYSDALSNLDELLARPKEKRGDVDEEVRNSRAEILQALLPGAPAERRQAFRRLLDAATTLRELRDFLTAAYSENNWIEFRDTGHGMSQRDLQRAYLLIGTPARRELVQAAVSGGQKVPYLGEKGVGRLSAMRLGSRLHVTTARKDDQRLNILKVDWSEFADDSKLLEEIEVKPETGPRKPQSNYSGTVIQITDLQGSWSPKRIQEIAVSELARLWDPFSRSKRRFRVAIFFNGERVDIPRLDREVLELAHARVTGSYEIGENGAPRLELEMWCGDLGKGNPPETRKVELDRIDLRSLVRDEVEVSRSSLRTVGPFQFELYWYNRQRLRGVDSIGDRKLVLGLQKRWSGIMLFRDGYRVFPYGDDQDDWLGLDRKALASPGYKLNKQQFIGRVSITRAGNPNLVDQTNREGLKDCDEKAVLIETLYFAINGRLRAFLDEVMKRQKQIEMDYEEAERRVESLERRADRSLRQLEGKYTEDRSKLRELQEIFDEMRQYFADAKSHAEQVEDERDRMIQLAGIGLMLEVVAHELARSTEYTLRILEDARTKSVPQDVASVFGALRAEMKTMNRRLRVLDPLSVSGRQRKETFDFVAMVREILEGHSRQFERHGIEPAVVTGKNKTVMIHGVRGMFVQILENLINNSVYWMDLRREDETRYRPKIEIRIGDAENLMEYTDNGPGIQPSLREEVFKPFFSTKGKSRRQGLGLFIARDCASHHGGELYLSEERNIHKTRLNTFVLELPGEAK